MMRDMQREFDKHPIQVTTVADAPTGLRGVERAPGQTTITYNGPVIHGGAAGAQLAWNNTGTVSQQQTRNEQIAPGFEALAQAVVSTRQGLSAVGLSEQDLQDAEAAADEVLTEVTQETPDPSRLRRSVAALKGLLAPIATGWPLVRVREPRRGLKLPSSSWATRPSAESDPGVWTAVQNGTLTGHEVRALPGP